METIKSAIDGIVADERKERKARRFDPDYWEYHDSRRWECKLSPTNAHHWLHLFSEVWQCRYCESYRYFPDWYNRHRKYDLMYRRIFSKKEVQEMLSMLKEVKV